MTLIKNIAGDMLVLMEDELGQMKDGANLQANLPNQAYALVRRVENVFMGNIVRPKHTQVPTCEGHTAEEMLAELTPHIDRVFEDAGKKRAKLQFYQCFPRA